MMDNNELLLQIHNKYNRLTKTERRIADYVLDHPQEILYMSISDLAEKCNVGDSSVFRFCRTLKFQGYQEFKVHLSLGMRDVIYGSSPEVLGTKDEVLPPIGTFERTIQIEAHRSIEAIKETCALIEKERFMQVIETLESANQISFFGVGSSLIAAEIGANMFLHITSKARFFSDLHTQMIAASLLTRNDVAVIISYSGSTKDTVHVAKLAKQAGANVVCVTRYDKSILTKYADHVLLCGTNEGPLEDGSAPALISQIILLDLLLQEYFHRSRMENRQKREITSKAILDRLY